MRARLLLPLLLVPLLAGCSASVNVGGLDIPKIEREAKGIIEKQTTARVKGVDCPDDQDEKKGANFLCRATGTDGSTGDVTITQTDDKGNVRVSADFLHVREAEGMIARGVEQQTKVTGAQVGCPEIVVGRKGQTFECSIAAEGSKGTVRSTFTDNDGNFSYKVVNASGG